MPFRGELRANPTNAALLEQYENGNWTTVFDFRDCLCMDEIEMNDFRQNPANKCQLQYSKNGGQNWILAFDYSLCQPATPTNTRYTDDGQYEESYDHGQTWTPAPEKDERFSGSRDQGFSGASASCDTAHGLRVFLSDMVNEISAAFSGALTFIALFTIVVGILAVIFSAGALTTLATLVVPFISFLLSLGAQGIAGAFTTAFWDDFECQVYCIIKPDNQISTGSFDAIMAYARAQNTPPWSGVALMLQILGAVGASRAATRSGVTAGQGACDECGCNDCPETCTELAHGVIASHPESASVAWSRPNLFVYASGYVEVPAGDWIEYRLGSEYCVMKFQFPTADFMVGTRVSVKVGNNAPFEVVLQNQNHAGIPNAGFVIGVNPVLRGDKIRITAVNGTFLNSDLKPFECT